MKQNRSRVAVGTAGMRAVEVALHGPNPVSRVTVAVGTAGMRAVEE
jgi:S-adenosylmethionine:tRNA-ribosyltransferase-isomerase (queuine synthetase)